MTYAQQANFASSQGGAGFVTLGNGQGYTYGPVQNPASTTYGFAEALADITNTASANYGKALWVYLNGAAAFTTQIVIPSGVTIFFPNNGGEAFGPVLGTPTGYLSFTGLSTVADPIEIEDGTANIQLIGFAAQTAVTGLNSLAQFSGTRGLYSENLYIVSTAVTFPALICAGITDNMEDCYFVSTFLSGDIALQSYNTNADAMLFNDSVFMNLCAEGLWNGSHFVVSSGQTVINVGGGTNVQLYNFYSRGNSTTNVGSAGSIAATQIFMQNVVGTPQWGLFGGEQRAFTVSAGGLWDISAGTLYVFGCSVSAGFIDIDTTATATMVWDGNTRAQSNPVTITQANGRWLNGPFIIVTNVTYSGSGGSILPPLYGKLLSTGAAKYGMASYTNTGATNLLFTFQLDDTDTFIVSNDSGTAILTLTDGGVGVDTATLANAHIVLNVASGSALDIQVNGAAVAQFNSGGLSNYRNIGTAGVGVPAIYAAGALTLSTNSAPASLSLAPATGRYRISGSLNVLTGGTLTFRIKVTYHDLGGNAVTDIPVFTQQNSATLLVGGPTANSTGRFWFSMEITAITGTNIVVADNAGTYTAGTYYFTPTIEQLA